MNAEMFLQALAVSNGHLFAGQRWSQTISDASRDVWHNTLQQPFKDEKDSLQKQQIMGPMCRQDIRVVYQLCSGHYTQQKSMLPWPNKAKSSTHQASAQSPTTYCIYPNLMCGSYQTLVDTCLSYHNLTFVQKSSYLTTFAWQFGMFRIHNATIWSYSSETCFRWR